ncbi:transposase [Shewanella sp. 4t3-1-2LB]|jgi:REP element-mobilizing transposase RayT|uniref:transposase n=1 Tax=Shewanella sp. 4t3-1-2LB TaxID=2817682 RepID=UPI001A98E9D7|nr:transposase [Shewanella sp. 4t3-1-2LB]MBO1270592.1 transposase [Shewanella sp. 4t3-1-2LB]
MTVARRRLIDVASTPYYHVINRCVRRAFLCGEDAVTGRSYEHRREWIATKIRQLSAIFCIDICAYAVMNNHYHLVLKIDAERQQVLSSLEVIERWTQLFHPPMLVARFLKGDKLDKTLLLQLDALIEEWRKRLADISWFMRCLNEEIARKANKEDNCTGVFWEGRFKSQALLDEQALLTCMMYVDLNPIRAGIADSITDSDFTSIQTRIKEQQQKVQPDNPTSPHKTTPLKPLLDFDGATHTATQSGIPFHFADYLELIDWTGRAVRTDKRGAIAETAPKLLQQLGIASDAWMRSATEFSKQYARACGSWAAMCEFKTRQGGKWCRGKQYSSELYQ